MLKKGDSMKIGSLVVIDGYWDEVGIVLTVGQIHCKVRWVDGCETWEIPEYLEVIA